MSTNCLIGYLNKDINKFQAIYCHWNGSPDFVGEMLKENYCNADKVKALIALGNISFLEEEVNPPDGTLHSFEKPCAGVTVAYHRDRGDDFKDYTFELGFDFINYFRKQVGVIDYAYIYSHALQNWTTFSNKGL